MHFVGRAVVAGANLSLWDHQHRGKLGRKLLGLSSRRAVDQHQGLNASFELFECLLCVFFFFLHAAEYFHIYVLFYLYYKHNHIFEAWEETYLWWVSKWVFMCVCIYYHSYIYTHTYAHTHIHNKCKPTHMHLTHIYVNIHTYINVCIYTHIYNQQ